MTDGSFTPEQVKPIIPEAKLAPKLESPERVSQTKSALDRLSATTAQHSHPFRRHVEEWHAVPDRNTPTGVYESWRRAKTGYEDLRSIDLRTFVDDDSGGAYHMTLSYLPTGENGAPDSNHPLMLSMETPLDIGLNFGIAEAVDKGIRPQGRRFQDFFYGSGADTIPVKETDYSYVFSYRETGHHAAFLAEKAQMDVVLGILKDAHIMTGETKGPKVTDIVPELGQLTQPQTSPTTGVTV